VPDAGRDTPVVGATERSTLVSGPDPRRRLRFGTNFTEADRLFLQQVKEEAKADGEVRLKATADAFDNFSLAMRQRSRTSWSSAWSRTKRS